jgi:hypothetical protein
MKQVRVIKFPFINGSMGPDGKTPVSRDTLPIAADGIAVLHYKIGDVVDVPEALAESLMREGLVEIVKAPKPQPATPPTPTAKDDGKTGETK